MGAVDRGGGGCACPENVLIRSLVNDIILFKDDVVIMDMEAGIEHLGRATAKGVNTMVIIVEPGQRSIDTAKKITKMSEEIGINKVQIIANKVYGKSDEDIIKAALPEKDIIGIIPFSEKLRLSDRTGVSVLDNIGDDILKSLNDILTKLSF